MLVLIRCALVQIASSECPWLPGCICFCSAHLYRLLPGETAICGELEILLLCALVQIASRSCAVTASCAGFCSAHLYRLLPARARSWTNGNGFCSAHLYRLLRRRGYDTAQKIPSALRTCTDCFLQHGQTVGCGILLLCALVQIASAPALNDLKCLVLLLCALVQIASGSRAPWTSSRPTSALRTCTDCFIMCCIWEVDYHLLLCALVQIASVRMHECLSRNE